MAHPILPARTLSQVMRRIAVNIALIEETTDMLSQQLSCRRTELPKDQIAKLEETIRARRVSIVKQRAIAGALGYRA